MADFMSQRAKRFGTQNPKMNFEGLKTAETKYIEKSVYRSKVAQMIQRKQVAVPP